jgi:predicted transcriptional regulator
MSKAVEMLEKSPALLILAGGRPLAVLTRTDVLSFLAQANNG